MKTIKREAKTLTSLLLASCLLVSGNALAFFGNEPKSFDDCVLQNIDKATNKSAASMVYRSCNNKFPPTKATNQELEQITLEVIGGKFYINNQSGKTLKTAIVEFYTRDQNNQYLVKIKKDFPNLSIEKGTKESRYDAIPQEILKSLSKDASYTWGFNVIEAYLQ